MDSGVDRTHGFARGSLTLDAGDRLWNQGDIVRIKGVILMGREVSVHADPVHLAAFRDLLFPDDGDIVFRLTGDETGVAAHARGKIDGHPPLVKRIVDQRIS